MIGFSEEMESMRKPLFQLRDKFLDYGDEDGQKIVYDLLDFTTELEHKYDDYE